ncbi:uncharacterized protein LOC127843569 isoform X2 [Dreissena polymorpha]|uniref:uncharacterized protein LOC127843569 isoform X2 n=1 Tax=Dreissena polymorpha TaxID=45954 RepID=UPI002263B2EE|nr:uncharacterized protein LOC127843569 isoform X2 [Dreissena polymorpha]
MDFHYDTFIEDEAVDECDQIRAVTKKLKLKRVNVEEKKETWLNTASVTLANLDKVKPSVYNFGLADPQDLKATNLSQRKPKDVNLGEGTGPELNNNSDSSRALKAWGSNHSVPELINQYTSATPALPKPLRPASAKYSNGRLRPPSGKRPRPQSAKATVEDGIVSENLFGVKGAKYDPNGRPPKGVPQSHGLGWVGPPAGLKYPDRPPDGKSWTMELPLEDDLHGEQGQGHMGGPSITAFNHEVPPAPHGTPEPSSPEPLEKTKRIFELYIGDPYKTSTDHAENDADLYESSDDEDLFLPASPVNLADQYVNHNEHTTPGHASSQQTANQRESLRLELPTADDDYDEIDEVDTERLLAEAESVSQQFDLQSIIAANRNLQANQNQSAVNSSTHLQQSTNQNEPDSNHYSTGKESPSLDENTSKKKAEELVSEIIHENGLQFDKKAKYCNPDKGRHERSGVKFNEDVTTVNITPRNMGRKVEDLHHSKKKQGHHKPDNFVDLIEIKNRIEPVLSTGKAEFSERENLSPKSKPSIQPRPPSGKQCSPLSDANRVQPSQSNLKKSGVHHLTATNGLGQNKQPMQNRPRSAPLNRSAKPITTVTVDYGEIEPKVEEKPKGDKKKVRKTRDDVLTMMEALSMDESDSNAFLKSVLEKKAKNQYIVANKELLKQHSNETSATNLVSAPIVYKSDPEKNYYEISRHSSLSHADTDLRGEEQNIPSGTVIKTTKTIEFDEMEPKEIAVKCTIDPHVVISKEMEKSVTLNHEWNSRKPARRPSSAKPPVPKKPTEGEGHDRPGSRLGFVAMETDLSPREGTENKPKRPTSAPVSHKPVSASLKNKQVKDRLLQERREKQARSSAGEQLSSPVKTRSTSGDVQSCSVETSEDQHSGRAETLSISGPSDILGQTSVSKKVSQREKEERERVIDNLLDRTKTLVDEEEKNENVEVPDPTPETKKRKPRPMSAHVGSIDTCQGHSRKVTTPVGKRPMSTSAAKNDRHYASYARTGSAGLRAKRPSSGKHKVTLTKPVIITSNTPYFEEETEEDIACQELERKLAEKGVSVSAATLQRALYPPSGRTKYYQISADLPRKPSLTLLSHPKTWLPEEYKQLQRAEKNLARANEIMFLKEKAEKRRAYLASLTEEQKKKLKKRKGKKGGKKLRRSKTTL